MLPLYIHCPFCRYPVVVPSRERELPRRCRQCGKGYVLKGGPRRQRRSARSRSRDSAAPA